MTKEESKQLAIKLFATLKQRGVSVRRFATGAGIPLDRIYKWKQQSSGPGLQDFAIVKEWIDKNTYEKSSDIIPNSAPKTITEGDYISELKERIQELKQDKEDLKREKETLYNLLNTNLHALASTQQITQAQLKALIKWSVDESAGRDKQKSIQSLAKINKLVADLIPTGDGEGKNHGGI